MKKFALSLVAVAACAGAFRAYESYQQSGNSDALLAENVEALSDPEDPSYIPEKCYYNSDEKYTSYYKICKEGTEDYKYKNCADEMKTVNPFSKSSWCMHVK